MTKCPEFVVFRLRNIWQKQTKIATSPPILTSNYYKNFEINILDCAVIYL